VAVWRPTGSSGLASLLWADGEQPVCAECVSAVGTPWEVLLWPAPL
jgi:hypothetical protein